MPSNKQVGKCHICGDIGELTFEHVPPKAAFNKRPIMLGRLPDIINQGLEPVKHGKIQQRGAGGFTLCGSCNNLTGRWYGDSYADWCYQGFILYAKAPQGTRILYPFHVFPLRIIKQIMAMYFSTNGPSFRDKFPDLVEFVLNRERRYLNPSIKIYTYLMTGKTFRQSGVTSALRSNNSRIKMYLLSEISFPPFGYIMTIDSESPEERLLDISYFARYSNNEWDTLFLQIPVLPVHLYFPADYRTEEKIKEDYLKNIAFEEGIKS